MAVNPKKATTVILLSEKKTGGFEVLLLKRHEKSSFMGGIFVYPGGRVDRDDGTLEVCARCKGLSFEQAHRILGESIPPEESFAHWIAGVRELFEEAGVLLAYDRMGNPFQLKNRREEERFLSYRESLQKGKLSICHLAQEERLVLALDQLHYYAHWITPEARPERFDARFFLARHPAGQEAKHDQKETTVGLWLTPRKALEGHLKGDVPLSPPTLKTLEDLSRFDNIEEVFSSLKKREIQAVLPFLTKISDVPLILFPWDPDYEVFRNGEIPKAIDHGRPSGPGDNTTRLILREGRWFPCCRTL
jgi:8-oxo-dGTP pyrophosphatase MutT (NUDIX family)